MSAKPSLVWFRQDLRIQDNPALVAAAKRGAPAIPVFIWAPEEEGRWAPGAASRWWLHQVLASLDAELRGYGSRPVIRRGPSLTALKALVQETGAGKAPFACAMAPNDFPFRVGTRAQERKERSLTQTATTSAGGYRKCGICPLDGSINHGKPQRAHWRLRGSSWAERIPSRLWDMHLRASAPSQPWRP